MNKFFKNKWAVSLLSGLLLGLSFPPINLSFLSFPAFILLLHLAEKSSSYKETAYYTYAGILLWNILTTYWLMMASVGAGIGAILANSVLMTIPLCLARYFAKNYKSPVLVALLQASAWVAYEYLHHNWDLAWPWLAIGNAWSNQVSLIQYISITGHLGITFWVLFTSALAYKAFQLKTKKLVITTIVALLILPSASLISFGIDVPVSLNSETVQVSVIQPNHDSYEDYGGMSGPIEVLDSLFSITERTRLENTQLIVWPENAIDRPIRMESRTSSRISDSAKVWGVNFIVGSGLFTTYEEDVPILYRVDRQGNPYNVFNSTLFVEKDGTLSRYDKANLVPFVERMPFVYFLNAIDVFDWFDWGKLAQYGRGTTPDMINTDSFITPGLVCYDSVYPSWTREFVNNGADFITIITNDGWWGNSSGHYQHFAYARLRAIEFDRWIVRSANNGTSGIIRPDGTVEQKTEYWIRTGFSSSIPKMNSVTLYAKFGDWLSILCLTLSISFYIYRRFKPSSTSSELQS